MLRFTLFLRQLFIISSRSRHTRYIGDWSSDVCSSDLGSVIRGDVFDMETSKPIAGATIALQRNEGETQIGRASCREREWILKVKGLFNILPMTKSKK